MTQAYTAHEVAAIIKCIATNYRQNIMMETYETDEGECYASITVDEPSVPFTADVTMIFRELNINERLNVYHCMGRSTYTIPIRCWINEDGDVEDRVYTGDISMCLPDNAQAAMEEMSKWKIIGEWMGSAQEPLEFGEFPDYKAALLAIPEISGNYKLCDSDPVTKPWFRFTILNPYGEDVYSSCGYYNERLNS